MVTVAHRSALHCEGRGFAVTVLPASPYQVSYVPTHHVIGFTFERQRGVDAFGGARHRPFDAEPWRLAFTPAGCDVFSASDKGGEYLVLSFAPGDIRSTCLRGWDQPGKTVYQCGRPSIHATGDQPAADHDGWCSSAIFGDGDRCSCCCRARLSIAQSHFSESACRMSHDLPTLEADSRSFRGPTHGRHPPRGPCKRYRPLGVLSRPHLPGGDWHDAARRVGRAEDCTSTFIDRSGLTPRRPPKPGGCRGRDRLLKPRSHDYRFPTRAWYHSERMDANACLSTLIDRSQHHWLMVA